MCSTDLCLFSTQPNYTSKTRDKGHRKGWVEVSMDKKEKAKVPSTEISIGSTPNSRINRSVVAFWDHLYPGSIGKRTTWPVVALDWVCMARFLGQWGLLWEEARGCPMHLNIWILLICILSYTYLEEQYNNFHGQVCLPMMVIGKWLPCLYLNPRGLLSYFFTFSCWEGGMREALDDHLAAKVNPPHALWNKMSAV